MKTLKDYLTEAEEWAATPVPGDVFAFEYGEQCLVETQILNVIGNNIIVNSDSKALSLLESHGYTVEEIRRYGAVGNSPAMGHSLTESHMAEVDMIIQDIIDGEIDPYDIMTRPKTPEEEYVAKILQQEYETVAIDHRLHPDDDFEKILDIVVDHLADDYGHKEIDEDQDAAVVAAKDLENDIANPMPGVHEGVEREASPVERAILHRIMMQHPGMISRYGVEALMNAVEDVADFVGDVDEIGSSDVSGWVRQVERNLQDYGNDNVNETDVNIADVGEYDHEGDMAKDDLETIVRAARRLTGMLDDNENMPEWVQSKINKAADYVDTAADYIESNQDEKMTEGDLDEAEYQGRKVPLGKPMRGDVKKFKVYVKDPATGNIKKVNFGHGGTSAKRAGQKTMKIKKSNPARRKSFRARHNCDNPGPRTKARYWSCRAW